MLWKSAKCVTYNILPWVLFSRNVNKVWGIALPAWDELKPDEESGGCPPKTRIPRGVGGRIARSNLDGGLE